MSFHSSCEFGTMNSRDRDAEMNEDVHKSNLQSCNLAGVRHAASSGGG